MNKRAKHYWRHSGDFRGHLDKHLFGREKQAAAWRAFLDIMDGKRTLRDLTDLEVENVQRVGAAMVGACHEESYARQGVSVRDWDGHGPGVKREYGGYFYPRRACIDHPYRLVFEHKTLYVSEPYDFDWGDLLIWRDLIEQGWQITMGFYPAIWFPGRTVPVVFRPPSKKPQPPPDATQP